MKITIKKLALCLAGVALVIYQPVIAADLIKLTAQQKKNLNINTMPIQTASALTGQTYPADVVVPVNQMHVVSSAYAGLVDQVWVTAGQTVKKGQALAHVTSPELLSIQRDYVQSSAQKRLAKQSLVRDTALFNDGIIAEKRLQSTENMHIESAAQLNERRQLLKLSGMNDRAIANLESSGRYQSGLTMTAPVSGVVLEQMVTQGQRIDAVTPLLNIAQLSPLWIEIRVPLVDIKQHHIQKGLAVEVKGTNAKGHIIAMLPSMRAQDQTAIVRAEINQHADALFPSQMVDANILVKPTKIGSAKTPLTVPSSAIVHHQSRTYVFVEAPQGFIAEEVRLLSSQTDTSVIAAKLTGTEKIVVQGTSAIKASWLGMGGE